MKKKLILAIGLMCSIGFLQAQNWQTDFEQAKTQAAKESKTIIMVFQGSDWCAPCMKLNKDIWSTEEFINYANDHFVMLKVDFPRKKANALTPEQQDKNKKLAEVYNKNGYFPFIVVIDSEGNIKGQTGYKSMTPGEYIIHLTSFK